MFVLLPIHADKKNANDKNLNVYYNGAIKLSALYISNYIEST